MGGLQWQGEEICLEFACILIDYCVDKTSCGCSCRCSTVPSLPSGVCECVFCVIVDATVMVGRCTVMVEGGC